MSGRILGGAVRHNLEVKMCDMCDWEDLLTKIEEMLDDGSFDWAEDTLEGIYETVERMEHSTDRQWDAVENIAAKGR